MDVFKKRLVKLLILELPRLNGRYAVAIDACATSIEFALLHKQEKELLNSIDHLSQSLCDAKTRYETAKRKKLCGAIDVLLLRPYLEGTHVIMKTHTQAL